MGTVKYTAAIIALALSAASTAHAMPVSAIDLAELSLGPSVIGPVGPTVDSGFTVGDVTFGDFSGGAICPAGFADCVPPTNPEGTIYTYVQSVSPGADVTPNDPPFPNAANLADPGSVSFYGLDFSPAGFNGIAGYDFAQASLADVTFEITRGAGGVLNWDVAPGGEWTAGETITFFFQSTQAPSGPGGAYVIGNADVTAVAAGPLPTPVPLPPAALLLGAALFGLGRLGRKTKRH